MMVDVDTLSRRFGPIVAEYLCVAILLRNIDITKRPAAYDQDFVSISDPNKLIQLFQIMIYIYQYWPQQQQIPVMVQV